MIWEPIETAPKGEEILVCKDGFPASRWMVVDRGVRKQIWHMKGGNRRLRMEPTHWMFIPEASGTYFVITAKGRELLEKKNG